MKMPAFLRMTRESLETDKKVQSLPAGRGAIYTLLLALLPVLGPHIAHLPVWCAAFAGLMFAWRAFITWREVRRPTPLPSAWMLLVLMLAALAATLYEHRTIFGRDAGVTLLTVLLSLKLLETRSKRDMVVAISLSYFLILTNFFYSQSIGVAALMLLALVMITSALIAANRDAAAMPIVQQTRLAGVIILQAFPMMLVLFLLFPRVQGPLWGLPSDANAGVTGLSDSMSPGMITNLSLSDGIAFRVTFKGAEPPAKEMYWRGPVLSAFDGRNWRIMLADPRSPARFEPAGPAIEYSVTLEPSNKPWIFALEMPTRLPPNAHLSPDLQPLSDKPVASRLRYDAQSYPEYRSVGYESRTDLAPYLALPPRSNPRTRELAASWLFQGRGAEQVVNQALQYFRSQDFFYTLDPPLLDNDAVDQFLFVSKRGFCEHYASAFVVLMRAANIPARVVTGYQGGEINPVDGIFTVRQSDAHAWAEVWLRDRGWTRVDPTAAVSPARIERGMHDAMPQRFAPPLITRFTGTWSAGWINELRFNWEALSNRWNQLVLNYSPDRQRETLERLGMKTPGWQDMVVAMVIGLALISLAVTGWMLRVVRERDPVERAWIAFCRRLARAGAARAPYEGPLDYAARAAAQLRAGVDGQGPAAIGAIAQRYARLRYGPKPDKVRVEQFTQLVRNFRL
jgi:transglutaminase-like putative cysteine protease